MSGPRKTRTNGASAVSVLINAINWAIQNGCKVASFSLRIPNSNGQRSQILDQADRRHRRFVSTLFGMDCADESLYHLILNTGFLSVAEAAESITALLNIRKIMQEHPEKIEKPVPSPNGKIHFKNKSEAEFARILDMHQIEWKYEPRTFPVEWDAEGNVTLAFSPDFYLVQFDTYLELTTMNQRYVTEKNKKLRRVRELYPGTHIKIVYKKDFQTLVERFSQFGSPSQA